MICKKGEQMKVLEDGPWVLWAGEAILLSAPHTLLPPWALFLIRMGLILEYVP